MNPRNALKKLTCLLLAAVLACGLLFLPAPARAAGPAVQTGAGLAEEALRVIGLLGIMKGYTDGSLGEDRPLTRAEGAALISRMCWGGDDDSELFLDGNPGGYTDVEGHWAIGYLNYCTMRGLFAGTGEGKASPDRPVRTAEFCKLCLTALGYRSDREGFLGSGWAESVRVVAEKAGLLNGVASAYLGILSRQDAALILFHLLSCGVVAYDRLKANVILAGDGSPRTFGGEFLGITTVSGILAANGIAKLASVSRPYEDFSPAPNGVTTIGGLLLTADGRTVELKNVSPDLSLLGHRVIVTLSGDVTISVADAASNRTGGIELLTDAAGELLPVRCPVYVNYAPAANGAAELARALDAAERVVALSNDGDSLPELVFIDRWEYVGQLLSVSAASYPGHGRAYRFEKLTRYESYLFGSLAVGEYGRIRQVGLYSFLEQASRRSEPETGPVGQLALLTGISVRSGASVPSVEAYLVCEDGTQGVSPVEGLSLNGRSYRLEELTNGDRALAETLTGIRLDGFRGGVASGLRVLLGVIPGEAGGVILSPTFDRVRDPGMPGQLTVYSDYTPGDISFGLGEDGRERYLDDRSVFFLEGPDGWMACRGDIPALEKAIGQQFVDVWYANMFSPTGSDGLYIRAAVATREQIGVDMQSEYAFLLVLSAGEPKKEAGRTLYPLTVSDGRQTRELLADTAAQPGEILRGAAVTGGVAILDRSSYVTGSLFSGTLLSSGANILVLQGPESNLVFDYTDAKCYKIEGGRCSAVDGEDLRLLAGCRVEVIGRNYGRANLVFLFV